MKTHIIGIAILVLGYSGCTPPMYIPNTTNTPSLRQQGDLEVSGSVGTNGLDAQAAYAVTDQWGVMLNGSQGTNNNMEGDRYLKHYFLEAGGGRAIYLDGEDANPTTRPMLNIYGTGGFGYTEGRVLFSNIFNSALTYENAVKGSFLRFALNPSIGITSRYVEFFFTPRTSFVHMTSLWTSLEADWNNSYISENEYNQYLSVINRKPYNLFLEPTLTLRIGVPYVKLMLQAGTSLNSIPTIETNFRQRPIILIAGLQMDINVLGKALPGSEEE